MLEPFRRRRRSHLLILLLVKCLFVGVLAINNTTDEYARQSTPLEAKSNGTQLSTKNSTYLIDPVITRAFIESCRVENKEPSKSIHCDIKIWTRASSYRLIDVDILEGKTGKIERSSDKFAPKQIKNVKSFMYSSMSGNEKSYEDNAASIQNYLKSSQIKTPLIKAGGLCNDKWLMCQAYGYIKQPNSDGFDICFRDGKVRFLSRSCAKEMLDRIVELEYPVTASASYTDTDAIYRLDFDLSGSMIVTSLPLNITNPSEMGVRRAQWFMGTVDGKMSDRRFAWMADDAMSSDQKAMLKAVSWTSKEASYLLAATPIYYNFDKQPKRNTSLRRGDRLAYKLQAIQEVTKNEFGLCYANDRNKKGNNLFKCLKRGAFQFENMINVYSSDGSLTVHALHIATQNASTYYHIAYNYVDKSFKNSRYFHCVSNAISPDVRIRPVKYDLSADISQWTPENKCGWLPIDFLPSDIVGFESDKCRKTIAFFDPVYTVNNINEHLALKTTNPKVLRGLNFPIYAAFSLGTKFFFFTGSNSLVIADGSMDNACEVLSIDFSRGIETFSHDYVVPVALSGTEVTRPPLIDFREYEKGASDTNPSLAASSISEIYKQSLADSVADDSGSWNILLAMGLILGALIVAGLVYMCCFKSSNERPSRKSHKSKRNSPVVNRLQVEDNLTAKTARSGLMSSILQPKSSVTSSIKVSPQASPPKEPPKESPISSPKKSKSKSKSPIKSAKSTKSTKSRRKINSPEVKSLKSTKTRTHSPSTKKSKSVNSKS